MYICIYMYVYTHVCIYVHLYICICIHMYIHIYIHIYTHARMKCFMISNFPTNIQTLTPLTQIHRSSMPPSFNAFKGQPKLGGIDGLPNDGKHVFILAEWVRD